MQNQMSNIKDELAKKLDARRRPDAESLVDKGIIKSGFFISFIIFILENIRFIL